MCPRRTGISRERLGRSRPVVDREASSDALLVGDVAHAYYTAEQGGPRACEGGDGLEVDEGMWWDVL